MNQNELLNDDDDDLYINTIKHFQNKIKMDESIQDFNKKLILEQNYHEFIKLKSDYKKIIEKNNHLNKNSKILLSQISALKEQLNYKNDEIINLKKDNFDKNLLIKQVTNDNLNYKKQIIKLQNNLQIEQNKLETALIYHHQKNVKSKYFKKKKKKKKNLIKNKIRKRWFRSLLTIS